MSTTGLAFPLTVDDLGRVAEQGGDDGVRGRIIQVLLTSPGERVHLPEFGCGLRNLLFDPNNEILAAATEFTVNASLQHWLGDEIIVEGVDIKSEEGTLTVEVSYVLREKLERSQVKIVF